MRSIVVLLGRNAFQPQSQREHRVVDEFNEFLCALCGSVVHIFLRPRRARPWAWNAVVSCIHQRRFTKVCITWSCVLIVCAFAWYTRCAVIMLTSSPVM